MNGDGDGDELAWLNDAEVRIGYKFQDPSLLRAALTHSSHADAPACCYQRLEVVGDATLGLIVTNYLFLAYPDLDAGDLSLLRSANISTDKLARVAVRHGLYYFLRRSTSALDAKVEEFAEAIDKEDDEIPYNGVRKAPTKVLADIVESVAAAVYVDCGFNLKILWLIFRGILEPFVTKETLQLQPVTTLFELCQKQGKHANIKLDRKGSLTVASVYVDGELVGSGSSEEKYMAKLLAAKVSLQVLSDSVGRTSRLLDLDNSQKSAKHQLSELCRTCGWSKPDYKVDKAVGPGHDKRFYCSVKVETPTGFLVARGYPKSKVKDAENAVAAEMLDAVTESNE